jgi:hypothetical protein
VPDAYTIACTALSISTHVHVFMYLDEQKRAPALSRWMVPASRSARDAVRVAALSASGYVYVDWDRSAEILLTSPYLPGALFLWWVWRRRPGVADAVHEKIDHPA